MAGETKDDVYLFLGCWVFPSLCIDVTGKWLTFEMASRLVKSSDSHASEPRSHLGGSSWLCYEKFISEFNERREIFLAPPCVKRGKQAVRGRKSSWPCSIQKYCRVQRN